MQYKLTNLKYICTEIKSSQMEWTSDCNDLYVVVYSYYLYSKENSHHHKVSSKI